MASKTPTALLEDVFAHFCFVEPLPSKPEENARQIDDEIARRLALSLTRFSTLALDSPDDIVTYAGLEGDIQRMRELHRDGILEQRRLLDAFATLERDDLLILHVAQQNAGLRIRRILKNTADIVIFEAFEVSARSSPTLAARGPLHRDFPGVSAELPYSKFISSEFQAEATSFLERASMQAVEQMIPKTWKAGAAHAEIRDTTHPALITDIFMGIIETLGCRVSVPQLRKHVWDCVLWADGAKVPWRRSSFWLAIRVGLQRMLYDRYGPHKGYIHYKFLMCVTTAAYLQEVKDTLHPTLVQALICKLGRRLAKVTGYSDHVDAEALTLRETLSKKLEPFFTQIITLANTQIRDRYDATHSQNVRRPRFIAQRPSIGECQLELNNSYHRIQIVLQRPHTLVNVDIHEGRLSDASNQDYHAFSAIYRTLASTEDQLRDLCMSEPSPEDLSIACKNIARQITKYISKVGSSYVADPLQMSCMLLTLLELWTAMDKAAIRLYPLLADFAPAFPNGILDKLLLPLRADLERAQAIDRHLENRHRFRKSSTTIFADPTEGCFAEQWYDCASNSEKLQGLRAQIETQNEKLRNEKKEEWEEMMIQYRAAWTRWLETDCTGIMSEVRNRNDELEMKHIWSACPKHNAASKFMFLSLNIHEHMLPNRESHLKALLVEYHLPQSFICYRDATWKIISAFGQNPISTQSSKHAYVLAWNYGRLAKFPSSRDRTVSLGSVTKSFDQTHYKLYRAGEQGLPKFTEVCKPNSMRLRYCLSASQQLINGNDLRVSFDHLFVLTFPPSSPFASLQYAEDLDLNGQGPTSNQIIASQTKCPSGLSPHEFKAFLALVAGKERRWLEILIAMSSTDLNFSSEAVAHLITRQVLQIGPRGDGHFLRICHHILQDVSFCDRLLQQLALRIANAGVNWRETTTLDLLLTIVLRLTSFSTLREAREGGLQLVHKIRKITWGWIKVLRDENLNADSAAAALTAQKYCRAAALICKRTFVYHLEQEAALGYEGIRCFIEASIALQDNLPSKKQHWPPNLRQRLVQDIKMVHRLRDQIFLAIELDTDAVIDAIVGFWPTFSDLKEPMASRPQLSVQSDGWVTIITDKSSVSAKRIICLSWLEGHLFVNGNPMGNLPAQYRGDLVLNELFGERILRTSPSWMMGMSYVLAITPSGNQVHLGFRDNFLVVRTFRNGQIKELISREFFRGGKNSPHDLPESMIAGCTHWLDLQSRCVEIRRDPDVWCGRPGDWELDLSIKQACRRGGSLLVDPTLHLDVQRGSKLSFDSIARIFQNFELPAYITVWLPRKGPLHLKLDRLDLTFFVTPRGSLICRDLQAEIDSNQDAGTWHGLESMLVIRSVQNPRQRSILVPLGRIFCKPMGEHVQVKIEPNGLYARYTINEELGRLDSPPEPRLLYLKALLHTYTSRAVPDRLTKRTGVEEALQFLTSGICRPYRPLGPASWALLQQIAALSPLRNWYPEDLRVLETVTWDTALPAANQHEAFYSIVETIRNHSDRLLHFTAMEQHELPPPIQKRGESYLRDRALIRRRRYGCPDSNNMTSIVSDAILPDFEYDSRDNSSVQPAKLKMLEAIETLKRWPAAICNTADLTVLINNAPCIEGFDRTFSGNILDDCLTADVILKFGPLIKRCLSADIEDQTELIFLFSMLSYRADVNSDYFRLFASFAIFGDLKEIVLPTPELYSNFSYRDNPTPDFLAGVMETCAPVYREASDEDPNALKYLPQRRARAEREAAHKTRVRQSALALASYILKSWPSSDVDMQSFRGDTIIDPEDALAIVQPVLQGFLDNAHLSKFLSEVMDVLRRRQTVPLAPLNLGSQTSAGTYPNLSERGVVMKLDELFLKKLQPAAIEDGFALQTQPRTAYPATATQTARFSALSASSTANCSTTASSLTSRPSVMAPSSLPKGAMRPAVELVELENIVRPLRNQKSHMRNHYAKDLIGSIRALTSLPEPQHNMEMFNSRSALEFSIREARERVEDCKSSLVHALQSGDQALAWLEMTGMLPRMTTVTLLEQLRSVKKVQFGTAMKEALVSYGIAITTLQRLLRIEDALIRGHQERHKIEVGNRGHENWQPLKHPDWLLLEIDTNILMRPRQIEVTRATISPESASNSLLQLQMGQGKSLCIVPAAAAALADTTRLVRVVVPRPLLSQTAQELQRRLGGLLGRYIMHVPFSRRTATTATNIKEYMDLHTETLVSGGIEVAIPEHMMSFKLSGQQLLSDKKMPEATQMMNAQRWLQENCRDILDESDHILSPKIQLIYPGGAQMAVDGSPVRWEIAQILLNLVAGHLDDLKSRFPMSIEVVGRPNGGLPFVYFLRKDVEDALVELLVKDAERGAIPSLPLPQCSAKDRTTVLDFISKPAVPRRTVDVVETLFADNETALHVVYLLRGALIHRLLLLTLKRRFQVNYGMHPTRPGLSVPFQYKGVPSDTAEWGHPDVAILFTCLSFYYEGLNEQQLRQSFQIVAKSDNPTGEYEHWIHYAKGLPQTLKDWNGINIDDPVQMAEVHKSVKYSMPAANHFLNAFVFPKYAKQFSTKLHASAWDIPLFSSRTNLSQHSVANLTTGFSGTTDGKYLFPLNIRQHQLAGLVHTDAEVLSFLLAERNRRYHVTTDRSGSRLNERGFLKSLKYQGIRVLIDAGAQIMEMDNLSLVQAWMKIDHEAKAGVYFNVDNVLTARLGSGRLVPLSASPFAEDLSECLVYFAQANCRGSDVALPLKAHAALTLSLGQNKDATVQAAMRLRQLGTTQRITWFATPEVDQSIRDYQKAHAINGRIDSAKVISWLLQQTCEGIESLTPLFYSQGKSYCERAQAETDNSDFLTSGAQRSSYLGVLRQPERETLKQLYAPQSKKQVAAPATGLTPRLNLFMQELNVMKQNFDDQAGVAVHSTALEEVEVEREYAYEVEQIREVQKPVHFKPLKFEGLHQNLKSFVRTGRLPIQSTAADLAFSELKRTGPGNKYGINSASVSSKLFVSTEFSRTVEVPSGQSGDNFLRQAKYILYSQVTDVAILVSPEEAEHLLELLRNFKEPLAHLLTFAAPVTRRMLIFNDLQFFNFPAMPSSWSAPLWLRVELGIFAGKLYFSWDEYDTLSGLLGLPNGDGSAGNAVALSAKPISLIQDLLDLRRKGQDFYNTPIGYITQGKKLVPDHAFFTLEDQLSTDDSTEKPDDDTSASEVSDHESDGKQDEQFSGPDEVDGLDD